MSGVEQDRPGAVLRAEHQTILRVVQALGKYMDRFEKSGDFAAPQLAKCVEFFRLFADACHHAKEEELLFPVLEARGIPRDGGPIGVMLEEHRIARSLTKEMADALPGAQAEDSNARKRFLVAARGYIGLLTNHIFKEDNVLFTMGDRVMSSDDQTSLAGEFCAVNCRAFEGRRRDQLERIADELEANGSGS